MVPCRYHKMEDNTTITDTHEVISPQKPPGSQALIEFERMHGRADNLMFRVTEEGRAQIKNELQSSAVKKRIVQSPADYDFKKDFLQGYKSKAVTARAKAGSLLLKPQLA